jgi:hypothetical protein
MTLAFVLIAIALVSLILIVRIGVVGKLQLTNRAVPVNAIEPLDLEAFRRLADPEEDAYLRLRLPAADLRRVRRARLRAIAAYVHVAGRNAGALVILAQQARAASDPQTQAAALQLLNQALLLRRNAALALMKIYVACLWPHTMLPSDRVLYGYQQLNGAAMLLGRLRDPASPVRISVG